MVSQRFRAFSQDSFHSLIQATASSTVSGRD